MKICIHSTRVWDGYDAFGGNLIPLDSTIIKISRTRERGFSGREPRVNGGVFAGIIGSFFVKFKSCFIIYVIGNIGNILYFM